MPGRAVVNLRKDSGETGYSTTEFNDKIPCGRIQKLNLRVECPHTIKIHTNLRSIGMRALVIAAFVEPLPM
jgi:hypothetical protein